jgi:hypothetical protein
MVKMLDTLSAETAPHKFYIAFATHILWPRPR